MALSIGDAKKQNVESHRERRSGKCDIAIVSSHKYNKIKSYQN